MSVSTGQAAAEVLAKENAPDKWVRLQMDA